MQKLTWLNQDNILAIPHNSLEMGNFMNKWQPNCKLVSSFLHSPEEIQQAFII